MKAKQKFNYLTVDFKMIKGNEQRRKSQSLPICKEKLAAINNNSSEEYAAIHKIIDHITFLCGFESFIILNIENNSGGNENERLQ